MLCETHSSVPMMRMMTVEPVQPSADGHRQGCGPEDTCVQFPLTMWVIHSWKEHFIPGSEQQALG